MITQKQMLKCDMALNFKFENYFWVQAGCIPITQIVGLEYLDCGLGWLEIL